MLMAYVVSFGLRSVSRQVSFSPVLAQVSVTPSGMRMVMSSRSCVHVPS